MAETIVIYHANCYDGFTAAWAAQRALGGAKLVPHTYGDPPIPLEELRDKKVIFVDYSAKRDVLLAIEKVAAELTVLDHHQTAQAELEGLDFCTFDMERSGAGLTWDTMHPDVERPWLIDYVEDRDLWAKKLDDSDAVNEFIRSHDFDLATWDKIAEADLADAVAAGNAMLRSVQAYVRKAVSNAFRVDVPPEPGKRAKMAAAVVCHSYERISDVLHELLGRAPEEDYAMAFFLRADGKWQFSLRSRPVDHEGHVNVGEIASSFGGGGHACAAGFELTRLPHWITGR